MRDLELIDPASPPTSNSDGLFLLLIIVIILIIRFIIKARNGDYGK